MRVLVLVSVILLYNYILRWHQTLGAALWQSVLQNFHIFLPVHYGDLLWSLGVLGFSVSAPSTVTLPDLQRMLAVLSRVYSKIAIVCKEVLWHPVIELAHQ